MNLDEMVRTSLSEVARDIQPTVPDPAAVRASVNRTSRIRVIAGTALAAAAAVIVIIVGSSLSHSSHRADLPVEQPSPTPTERLENPAGQQTITPDIGPGDIRGFDVLATVTNTQPEHRRDTELSATVTAHVDATNISHYCRSHDVPTWFAYADGDLVSDSPGAAHDWWTIGKCVPDDPTTLAPNGELGDGVGLRQFEQKTVRMILIAPPTAELRACLAGDTGTDYCPLPPPIAATDAEFGFRIYEEKPTPSVLELFDDAGNGEPFQFDALSSINGVGWLLDRAVVAAPDAERLAFELPASGEYLIDVYAAEGPHHDRCMKQHADEIPDWETTDTHVYEAAVDKVCGVDLRLVVDGTSVAREDVDPDATGHFTELGALMSPGTDHRVEVTVVRGDPNNVRYAVVVRARTQIP